MPPGLWLAAALALATVLADSIASDAATAPRREPIRLHVLKTFAPDGKLASGHRVVTPRPVLAGPARW